MKRYDHTSMGGSIEGFQTTHWSVIDEIAADSDIRNQGLINELFKKYWKPVYCFLRHRGYGNEKSKDLTQGFFQEVVLTRRLPQYADQARGRFRTLILSALEQYIARVNRQENAQKRIPKNKLLQLEQIELSEIPEPINRLTAEQSFNYAWLSSLLDDLLDEVRVKCCNDNKTLHWQVFSDRVLQPIIENTHPPSLLEICNKYGIESTVKASNMIITVNRRFHSALKRHVRRAVASDADVDKELKELMQMFSSKSAG